MDKDTKEALSYRLNVLYAYLEDLKLENAKEEILDLLKEAQDGVIVPF
ncbi:hypothetical protein [Clostridium oceanicum]|uniref:Uncharacterized protein n=1 Tax=Clostridium oceanicum TaxID=1543 RepID=A0ABN1JC20_9CLOT